MLTGKLFVIAWSYIKYTPMSEFSHTRHEAICVVPKALNKLLDPYHVMSFLFLVKSVAANFNNKEVTG